MIRQDLFQVPNSLLSNSSIIVLYLFRDAISRIENQLLTICNENALILSVGFHFPSLTPTSIFSTPSDDFNEIDHEGGETKNEEDERSTHLQSSTNKKNSSIKCYFYKLNSITNIDKLKK